MTVAPVCPNCGNEFGWDDVIFSEGLLPDQWHHQDCDNPTLTIQLNG